MTAERRLQTWLRTGFASLALVLAAIGVYGVIHYAIAERTREIGVRIALGAGRARILRLVISTGMRWPLFGIVLGVAGALGVTRIMSDLLFETGATDPVSFAAVA